MALQKAFRYSPEGFFCFKMLHSKPGAESLKEAVPLLVILALIPTRNINKHHDCHRPVGGANAIIGDPPHNTNNGAGFFLNLHR